MRLAVLAVACDCTLEVSRIAVGYTLALVQVVPSKAGRTLHCACGVGAGLAVGESGWAVRHCVALLRY